MDEDEYCCKRCGGIWEFFPEDYDYDISRYPEFCPHCEMPIMQMIADIWENEGITGIGYILKIIWCRIFN